MFYRIGNLVEFCGGPRLPTKRKKILPVFRPPFHLGFVFVYSIAINQSLSIVDHIMRHYSNNAYKHFNVSFIDHIEFIKQIIE